VMAAVESAKSFSRLAPLSFFRPKRTSPKPTLVPHYSTGLPISLAIAASRARRFSSGG
jgi:hypothetical protein